MRQPLISVADLLRGRNFSNTLNYVSEIPITNVLRSDLGRLLSSR